MTEILHTAPPIPLGEAERREIAVTERALSASLALDSSLKGGEGARICGKPGLTLQGTMCASRPANCVTFVTPSIGFIIYHKKLWLTYRKKNRSLTQRVRL